MFEEVINIVQKAKEKVTDDSDIVWTHYDSPVQFRNALDKYIEQLHLGNLQSLEELNILFAATGSLQEHSNSNGSAHEYLELAAQFDKLYNQIKN